MTAAEALLDTDAGVDTDTDAKPLEEVLILNEEEEAGEDDDDAHAVADAAGPFERALEDDASVESVGDGLDGALREARRDAAVADNTELEEACAEPDRKSVV